MFKLEVARLHIYHTNDVHSHFEKWPTIVHYIDKQREYHQQNKEDVLVLDIGDFVDRSHVITEGTDGKGNITLLNDAKYDAVTIGNNEGITLSKEALTTLYQEAKFPVLVANLYEEDGSRPDWIKPYTIRTLENGIRVGLIGLTVEYELFYKQLGWNIKSPLDALEGLVDEVKSQSDVIILLSHLGKGKDEVIAQTHKDIDVILGAHTHHVYEIGKYIENSLVCGAGKFGYYIGHVTLDIDVKKKELISKKAQVISTDNLHGQSLHTVEILQQLEEGSEEVLKEQVVTLKESLPLEWFAESPFTSLLASKIRHWCDAEIGMINAGILLEPLPRGVVTKGDIHRICPHPINPCRLLIKGGTLQSIIRKAEMDEIKTLKVKGLGFRGEVMGKMIYDGVTITLNEIYINGELLEEEREYRLGTLDMFTFGFLFPEFQEASEKNYYMPELLRDVLQEALHL